MKSRILVLAAMTVLSTAVLGHAMLGPRFRSPTAGEGAVPGPSPAELGRVLELTEAQQKQVTLILGEERAKEKARHQREQELGRQLREMEEAAVFDEQAARKLASELADLDAERLVGHLKTRHRIDALLSAEQRERAKKLRPEKAELRPPQPPRDDEAAPAPEAR